MMIYLRSFTHQILCYNHHCSSLLTSSLLMQVLLEYFKINFVLGKLKLVLFSRCNIYEWNKIMNNTNTTTTPTDTLARQSFNLSEEILLHAVQVIIAGLMIFSIITNAIVIRIFLSKKFGQLTTAKILYANISLSDELFLLTCIFQAIIYGDKCNGNCRIAFSYATHISGFVSTYTMALIAFKRYHVMAFPMQNRSNSSKWPIFVSIFCVWCF